jgi:hypothetical protein
MFSICKLGSDKTGALLGTCPSLGIVNIQRSTSGQRKTFQQIINEKGRHVFDNNVICIFYCALYFLLHLCTTKNASKKRQKVEKNITLLFKRFSSSWFRKKIGFWNVLSFLFRVSFSYLRDC